MVGDIVLAGYTLTPDEWRALDMETREELSQAVSGAVEVDLRVDEDWRGPQIIV